MKVLDGKIVSQKILTEVRSIVSDLPGRKPSLAAIISTDNPASLTYVSRKVSACNAVGIVSTVHKLKNCTKGTLIECIKRLNEDSTVDGILVQLPLPTGIDPLEIMQHIDPAKDVDGFHPINMGKLLTGDRSGFVPCTPLGIKVMMEEYSIPVEGKQLVVVGRSNIVGKPLAALMMQNDFGCNATVTIAHSKTKNLKEVCLTADILVAAIGQPQAITADMVKTGAVVVDVGISRDCRSNKLVGDVCYHEILPHCTAITPVPGGVGPMTIAMLLKNTLKSYLSRRVL